MILMMASKTVCAPTPVSKLELRPDSIKLELKVFPQQDYGGQNKLAKNRLPIHLALENPNMSPDLQDYIFQRAFGEQQRVEIFQMILRYRACNTCVRCV